MSSPLAKLMIQLGLDATGVDKGVESAKKSVGTFGINASTAFKGIGLAAGAGFLAVTKGAVEAERAQGNFMAATGATRDEAKKFVSGMDSLAGSAGAVGKSFDDIAATGTMVAQQFGTTGQATTDLTGYILDFAKVTKQDATGAAADLEDTLSSFGLSASDASGFMDELVASNQKFGTEVGPEALGILRNMAPALQDMGLGLDDGVGLLNAFETAGLNASAAQKGLNTALKNLPPGGTFDDLVAKLGAIEDPAARAKEAIKLFGTQAGPKLAQIIQPGMTSLDDFKVSAEDAAGKTGKAADDMLTFTDRIQGWAQKALAGARELGQQFGPALSGVVAIAGALGPKLVDGVGKAWDFVRSSSVVKQAIEDAAAGAGAIYTGAKEFAEHILEGIKVVWDEAIGHGPIHDAITKAGAIAGGIYTTAKEFIEKALAGIKGVWVLAGSPGSGVLNAAADAGAAAGTAFGGNLILGLGTLGLGAAGKFGSDFLTNLFGGQAGSTDSITLAPGISFGRKAATAISQTILDEVAAHAKSGHEDYAAVGADIGASVADGTDQGFSDGLSSSGNWGDEVDSKWQDEMSAAASRNKNSMVMYDIMVANHEAQTKAAEDIWNASARAITGDMTGTLKSAKKDISSAMDDLLWAINHPMALEKDILKVQAELNSKTLKDALASKNPEIAAEAQQTQQKLLDLWAKYDPSGYAAYASQQLRDSLNNGYPGALADALAFVRDINATFQKLTGKVGIHINVSGDEQYGHGQGYATGGYVPPGTFDNRVGERGIERLDMLPGGGAIVTPLSSAASASVTINAPINIYDARDPETVAKRVHEVLDEFIGKAQQGAHVRWSAA